MLIKGYFVTDSCHAIQIMSTNLIISSDEAFRFMYINTRFRTMQKDFLDGRNATGINRLWEGIHL